MPSRIRRGFRAAIVLDGKVRGETAAAPFVENRWVHLAVVLDPASRVLTTYLDGARAGQAADVTVNAAQIVNQTDRAANRLFIGRSQDDAAPAIHARLRDVRIYRIALNESQVATIRKNALAGPQTIDAPRRRRRRRFRRPRSRRNRRSPRRCRTSPTSPSTPSSARCPACRSTCRRAIATTAAGPNVRVIWPAPVDNSEVMKPGHLHRDRQSAGHVVRAEGHGDRQGSGRDDHGAEPPGRTVRAQRRRARARHEGARHAVHQEPRQVRARPRGQQSRQLPLQLQGRVRTAAACRRHAARRLGQPDDEAARTCERPLPVGDRAGLREHDLRRGAARELPAEDELPDRHAVRPVAEIRTAGGGRRSRRGRSDGRSRGRRARGLRLESQEGRDPHGLLELGRRVHQRVPAGSVHHARKGRHLRHAGLADLGARTTRCTRFSRACSTATKSRATRRRSTSRKAWARGPTRG